MGCTSVAVVEDFGCVAELDLATGVEGGGGERALVILSVVPLDDEGDAAEVPGEDLFFTCAFCNKVDFGCSTFCSGPCVAGTTGSEASTAAEAISGIGEDTEGSSVRTTGGSVDIVRSTFSGSITGSGTDSEVGFGRSALRARSFAKSGPRLVLRSCRPETVLPGN
jgi:hypothetical protein